MVSIYFISYDYATAYIPIGINNPESTNGPLKILGWGKGFKSSAQVGAAHTPLKAAPIISTKHHGKKQAQKTAMRLDTLHVDITDIILDNLAFSDLQNLSYTCVEFHHRINHKVISYDHDLHAFVHGTASSINPKPARPTEASMAPIKTWKLQMPGPQVHAIFNVDDSRKFMAEAMYETRVMFSGVPSFNHITELSFVDVDMLSPALFNTTGLREFESLKKDEFINCREIGITGIIALVRQPPGISPWSDNGTKFSKTLNIVFETHFPAEPGFNAVSRGEAFLAFAYLLCGLKYVDGGIKVIRNFNVYSKLI